MSSTHEAAAILERAHPEWQVWIVCRYIGGPLWCARHRDDHRRLLHADTSAELEQYLDESQP
jgi:hypothetical protein